MRIAFVFPGQGSQSVGMLGGFADNETVRGALARADEALGFSIERLIAEGPAEELNLTVNTQPAVLASSVAFYEAWLAAGGQKPELLAGHSLGEYSALCAAGVFPLEEAVKLVRFRAEAMQSAVPVGVGGMAAIIGLSDEDVEAACVAGRAAGTVEAVNFNSPGQVVIAGHIEAVRAAVEDAKARGARRAIELPVSAPFHSSLLESAAKRLAERLEGVAMAEPSIPVIANVDVTVHKTPEEIRAALARQACSAVQWVKTIERMKREGVTHIVECGPGKVLAGLIRRIAPEIRVLGIATAEQLEAALAEYGLDGSRTSFAASLSEGAKRDLAIACALLHRPKILFLDEATSGADLASRRALWRRVARLAADGTAVVVTTHFLEEAEYCDRFLIQDRGRVLILGTPDGVRRAGATSDNPEPTMEEAFIEIVERSREEAAS